MQNANLVFLQSGAMRWFFCAANTAERVKNIYPSRSLDTEQQNVGTKPVGFADVYAGENQNV